MAEPIQPTEPTEPGDESGVPQSAEIAVPESAQTAVVERVEPDSVAEPTAKKPRRRWLGWVIALGVLITLLIVGFIVGDAYARQYAKDYVREQVIQVLALPADTAVDVDLGAGSLILQAIAGSISEVTVGIDELTVGPITGSARLVATGVPLDGTQPLETLAILVTIPQSEVRKLARNFSGLELKSIDLANGLITIGTEVNILNFLIIPIAIDLAPSAAEGSISFDPRVIRVGTDEISVADLRASPEFSAFAGDLLNSQDLCVASSLPKALTVTDASVVGSSLVITLSGDGAALGGPEMATLGECSRK